MRYVNTRAREVVGGALTRELAFFFLGIFAVNMGFAVHRTVYTNYAVEVFGISGTWRGLLESIREVPGLLTVFAAAATVAMARSRLAALSLLVMGLGIGGFSLAWSVPSLVLFNILWSIGFHSWGPVRSSLALTLAGSQQQGRRLGQVRAVTAFAGLMGMFLVERVSGVLSYRVLFILAGLFIVLGGMSIGSLPSELGRERGAVLVFRRRYWLYYTLNFMEGCRRQLFSAFAPFALVQLYHVSVQQMARLMLVSSVANLLASPVVGLMVDRWGERRTLSLNFSGMALVFLGFGLSSDVPTLYLLYCLGNLLFVLGLAVTTHLQKVALPGDLSPSLATGQTMNHISAVAMPFLAGLLWTVVDPQWVFFVGIGVSLVSFVVSQRMRT